MSEKTKSDGRTGLDSEWKRLKNLIPEIIDDRSMVDAIERDVLDLIDGKSTSEDIIKSQKLLSKDGVILILLKLEKEEIISCIEPVEKLRDIRFDKHEAEKELEFMLMEKKRILNRISKKEEDILDKKAQNREIKNQTADVKNKIKLANKNIEKLNENYKEAMNSVDRLVSKKVDMLKRNTSVDRAVGMIKEEVIYLKDEKWSAMRSIKDLESKIEEILKKRATITPKMSVYRSVVREAYKTLRDAQVRADHALKGVE